MQAKEVAKLICVATRVDQFPKEGPPEVAFVGRSNVGKSSLINTLVGRKSLARTSQTPGKTRAIHFYSIGDRFTLVDLPGYGYARVPRHIQKGWKNLVEGYLGGRTALRLVVLILDIRRIPDMDDIMLKQWLEERELPTCFVITKADKVSKGKRAAHMSKMASALGVPREELIAFSSRTGEGKRELWSRIRRHLM
jgi:GTP-binding protein